MRAEIASPSKIDVELGLIWIPVSVENEGSTREILVSRPYRDDLARGEVPPSEAQEIAIDILRSALEVVEKDEYREPAGRVRDLMDWKDAPSAEIGIGYGISRPAVLS